jgi:hypothetical protein
MYLRLLWNAVVSLNTIVEFVVLHRCNYEADLERNELLKKADKYEKRFQNLTI